MNAQNQRLELPSLTDLLAGRRLKELSVDEAAMARRILKRDANKSTQRILETLNRETAAR